MRAKRILGAFAAVLSFAYAPEPVGAAEAGGNPSRADALAAADSKPDALRWGVPPPGVDPRLWKPVVNPPNAPKVPPRHAPRRPMFRSAIHHGCYPPYTEAWWGEGGLCREPGGLFGDTDLVHWSHGNAYAYVYVIDALGRAEAKQWLHYTVNLLNQWRIYGTNRPHFVLYTASQLGRQVGDCGAAWDRYIEVCEHDYPRPVTYFDWDSANHIRTADVFISRAASGHYLNYSVMHEVGHTVGFAHDTNCQSVMTYCGTVGNQFLTYAADQHTVYSLLYDNDHDEDFGPDGVNGG